MHSSEARSADLDRDKIQETAHAPLSPSQRRAAGPLLALAFGWGFLVTGLLTGGALGQSLPFSPDLLAASLLGNFINFLIGAAVGYIGYRSGCNSGLLFQLSYGRIGALLPVMFVALLTLGWQGIVVGAFGFAWTQSLDSPAFYAVAILAGCLYTGTTYFGVGAIEKISLPSVLALVAVGVYAMHLNVTEAGGWTGFLALSAERAATGPAMTFAEAVNLVIGSWIVGAIVMAEYTRFARRAWVAIAIPFVVLIVSQWFLQLVGSAGGIVSGTHEFTTYMLAQGAIVGLLGVIAMSLALWTTGDANLYLPAVQTASVLRQPQRRMTLICGAIGTLLGLGIYQHFLYWIDLLAVLVPPLIAPVIVEFYLFRRRRFAARELTALQRWNPRAVAAYVTGAAIGLAANLGWITVPVIPSLLGLLVSAATYTALSFGSRPPTDVQSPRPAQSPPASKTH